MENLTYEDLSSAIHDYIKENYDYEHADIMGDEIVYHLKDGKNVYINIVLDKE